MLLLLLVKEPKERLSSAIYFCELCSMVSLALLHAVETNAVNKHNGICFAAVLELLLMLRFKPPSFMVSVMSADASPCLYHHHQVNGMLLFVAPTLRPVDPSDPSFTTINTLE
jgi:hypothetical protein